MLKEKKKLSLTKKLTLGQYFFVQALLNSIRIISDINIFLQDKYDVQVHFLNDGTVYKQVSIQGNYPREHDGLLKYENINN